jgi:hypothetical protein
MGSDGNDNTKLGKANTLADDLLASDALLFLTSCLLSYVPFGPAVFGGGI